MPFRSALRPSRALRLPENPLERLHDWSPGMADGRPGTPPLDAARSRQAPLRRTPLRTGREEWDAKEAHPGPTDGVGVRSSEPSSGCAATGCRPRCAWVSCGPRSAGRGAGCEASVEETYLAYEARAVPALQGRDLRADARVSADNPVARATTCPASHRNERRAADAGPSNGLVAARLTWGLAGRGPRDQRERHRGRRQPARSRR